jgi:hypothetical protein
VHACAAPTYRRCVDRYVAVLVQQRDVARLTEFLRELVGPLDAATAAATSSSTSSRTADADDDVQLQQEQEQEQQQWQPRVLGFCKRTLLRGVFPLLRGDAALTALRKEYAAMLSVCEARAAAAAGAGDGDGHDDDGADLMAF